MLFTEIFLPDLTSEFVYERRVAVISIMKLLFILTDHRLQPVVLTFEWKIK